MQLTLQACPAGTFYSIPVDDESDLDPEDTDGEDGEDTDGEDTDGEDTEDEDDYYVCANCPVNTYSANPASTACAACPGAPAGSSVCVV